MNKGTETKGLGIALDIGTTTLSALLIERSSGRLLADATCLNSQKAYGLDVISRISYTARYLGSKQLQNAVLADIKQLIAKLCARADYQTQAINAVVIAANPTMIHLLAGVDPAPLGQAPYTLVLSGPLQLNSCQLDLALATNASIYCLPAAAAYLGGDIVGGLLTLNMDISGSTRLLLDIGTNGEIVLCHNDRIWACSTAAGPALEGMNISCGMRAAAGAIDEIEILSNQVHYRTIGGLPPLGLAGSGLLSAVSALIKTNLLGKNGRLLKRSPIKERKGQRCLVIDKAAAIALTQSDIRQIQLAKGAIRAGLETLLDLAACPLETVEQVLIAGNFGAHLKTQDLIITGMLPPIWAGKIHYVGNTALSGARLALLSIEARHRAEVLAKKIDYIELATLSDYQQYFLHAIKF